MTTLNSKKAAVPFNPEVHAKGPVTVTAKGRKRDIPGLVKDLGRLQLRRRLDNPHHVEWTVRP